MENDLKKKLNQLIYNYGVVVVNRDLLDNDCKRLLEEIKSINAQIATKEQKNEQL